MATAIPGPSDDDGSEWRSLWQAAKARVHNARSDVVKARDTLAKAEAYLGGCQDMVDLIDGQLPMGTPR